jgi:hypothetical protein
MICSAELHDQPNHQQAKSYKKEEQAEACAALLLPVLHISLALQKQEERSYPRRLNKQLWRH